MTTQTQTGSYLRDIAQGGHFKQKLGETALALTECFCKADMGNRKVIGEHLATQMSKVLREVYGWDHNSTAEAVRTLRTALRNTKEEGS